MAHDDPSQFPPDSEHEHEIEDLRSKPLDYIEPSVDFSNLLLSVLNFCFRFASLVASIDIITFGPVEGSGCILVTLLLQYLQCRMRRTHLL